MNITIKEQWLLDIRKMNATDGDRLYAYENLFNSLLGKSEPDVDFLPSGVIEELKERAWYRQYRRSKRVNSSVNKAVNSSIDSSVNSSIDSRIDSRTPPLKINELEKPVEKLNGEEKFYNWCCEEAERTGGTVFINKGLTANRLKVTETEVVMLIEKGIEEGWLSELSTGRYQMAI